MIIGNKINFAVEYEKVSTTSNKSTGRAQLWISNKRIGYYDEEIYLNNIRSGLVNIIDNKVKLANKTLYNKPPEEVFSTIYNELEYGNSNEFDCNIVGMGESFDDFLIYVLYHKNRFIFFWKLIESRSGRYLNYNYTNKVYTGEVSEEKLEDILKTYTKNINL